VPLLAWKAAFGLALPPGGRCFARLSRVVGPLAPKAGPSFREPLCVKDGDDGWAGWQKWPLPHHSAPTVWPGRIRESSFAERPAMPHTLPGSEQGNSEASRSQPDSCTPCTRGAPDPLPKCGTRAVAHFGEPQCMLTHGRMQQPPPAAPRCPAVASLAPERVETPDRADCGQNGLAIFVLSFRASFQKSG
jgi:hypothetical protein